MSEFVSTTPALTSKKGFLAKKGMGNFFRPWTIRQVVLDVNQVLSYYDEKNVLKGDIKLAGASVRTLSPPQADGREFAFEIFDIPETKRTQGQSLILAASYAAERTDWVRCLESACTSNLRQRAANGVSYTSFGEAATNSARLSTSENYLKMDVRTMKEARMKAKQDRLLKQDKDKGKEEDDEAPAVDSNRQSVNATIASPVYSSFTAMDAFHSPSGQTTTRTSTARGSITRSISPIRAPAHRNTPVTNNVVAKVGSSASRKSTSSPMPIESSDLSPATFTSVSPADESIGTPNSAIYTPMGAIYRPAFNATGAIYDGIMVDKKSLSGSFYQKRSLWVSFKSQRLYWSKDTAYRVNDTERNEENSTDKHIDVGQILLCQFRDQPIVAANQMVKNPPNLCVLEVMFEESDKSDRVGGRLVSSQVSVDMSHASMPSVDGGSKLMNFKGGAFSLYYDWVAPDWAQRIAVARQEQRGMILRFSNEADAKEVLLSLLSLMQHIRIRSG